jgi:hypothetical protein
MSQFVYYFAFELLREAGWPRKLGRFKGEGYDAPAVGSAFERSIEWGAALGAGRPSLALQMIAAMLREEVWEDADAPDLKVVVEACGEDLTRAMSPGEAVPLARFPKDATLKVEEFDNPEFVVFMELKLPSALVWGLTYPDRFEAWYCSDAAAHGSMLSRARKAGVEAGESPSLSQLFEGSAAIVRDYERDVAPLPATPPRLLAAAEALGWRGLPASSIVRCRGCERVLAEPPDLPSEVLKPCPDCGSTARAPAVGMTATRLRAAGLEGFSEERRQAVVLLFANGALLEDDNAGLAVRYFELAPGGAFMMRVFVQTNGNWVDGEVGDDPTAIGFVLYERLLSDRSAIPTLPLPRRASVAVEPPINRELRLLAYEKRLLRLIDKFV